MKTGIMGGTFDPIHKAHIIIAEEVRNHLELDEVLFVPAGQPWLKMNRNITAAEHRVAMVRLAIADKPYFKLSTIDIERAGPTYTVDTVTQLRVQINSEDELLLILGWDSVAELPQWQEPARLIKVCRIVSVPRPGYPRPDFNSLESAIPGLSRQTILMDKPEIDISATEIRDRVARGLSISHLVPETVERYIQQHGFYTSSWENQFGGRKAKTRDELEKEGWILSSTTSGAHLRRVVEMYEESGFNIYLEEITPEECNGCTVCYVDGEETIIRIYTRPRA